MVLDEIEDKFPDKVEEFTRDDGLFDEDKLAEWYLKSAITYDTIKHLNDQLDYIPLVYGAEDTDARWIADSWRAQLETYGLKATSVNVPVVGHCRSFFLGAEYVGYGGDEKFTTEFWREYYLLETGKIEAYDTRVCKINYADGTVKESIFRYACGQVGSFQSDNVPVLNMGWFQKFFKSGFQDFFVSDDEYYDLVVIYKK